MVALSVLDLSPVAEGTTGAQALHNSLDLARHCDALGFTRYWVAEHHNLPSIASSAPDIMIGQIAAITRHMRIGSGGVMLPNHAPLMVAERFKVLEALFPGRIDLGLGRAPGTDPATSYALRRRQGVADDDDFLERFKELMLIETRGVSGRASVPQRPRHAGGRAAAADLPARLVATTARSLPRRLARRSRSRIISRRSMPARRCRSIATISSRRNRTPSPMRFSATATVCADTDEEAEPHRHHGRSQHRAARQGRIPAARLAGECRRLSIHAGRSHPHCAEPRQDVGRLAEDGAGQARGAGRRDARRRGDGHDDDLRSCGAKALAMSCWRRRSA